MGNHLTDEMKSCVQLGASVGRTLGYLLCLKDVIIVTVGWHIVKSIFKAREETKEKEPFKLKIGL